MHLTWARVYGIGDAIYSEPFQLKLQATLASAEHVDVTNSLVLSQHSIYRTSHVHPKAHVVVRTSTNYVHSNIDVFDAQIGSTEMNHLFVAVLASFLR